LNVYILFEYGTPSDLYGDSPDIIVGVFADESKAKAISDQNPRQFYIEDYEVIE